MVIKEEDVSQSGSEQKPSKGKKIRKVLLIILAVWIGLAVFVGFLPDDEEESSNSVTKTEPSSEYEMKSFLIFPDFKFGCTKDELVEMMEKKGWVVTQSYKLDNAETNFALVFRTDREAAFQKHIIYEIAAEFDESGKFQKLHLYFDIRPEALEYQGYHSMERMIQAIVEDCLTLQGYKEVKIPANSIGRRGFSDSNKNAALLVVLNEKEMIYITYMTSEIMAFYTPNQN